MEKMMPVPVNIENTANVFEHLPINETGCELTAPINGKRRLSCRLITLRCILLFLTFLLLFTVALFSLIRDLLTDSTVWKNVNKVLQENC